MKILKITLLFLLFVKLSNAQSLGISGCPTLFIGNDTIVPCNGFVTLHAHKYQFNSSNTYQVDSIPFTPYPYSGSVLFTGTDDIWSPAFSLPFKFCFFGNTYDSFVVGSNGLITFNSAQSNAYNAWNFYSMPTPPYPDLLSATCTVGTTCGDAANSIMCPYHDIDPSYGGTVLWQIYGSAPCRRLVVTWDSIPMFSCTDSFATQQCVLYEGTSTIEIFIKKKPLCAGWNDGEAAEGIEDATGTNAYMINGRNLPGMWVAQNDGRRFTPNGTALPVHINWYDINHNLLATNIDSLVTNINGAVIARAAYFTCSNDSVIVWDTVNITTGGVSTSITNFIPLNCHGDHNASFVLHINSVLADSVFRDGIYIGDSSLFHFNHLAADTITFYVSDTSGCHSTRIVKIANPAPLIFNNVSHTNVSCNGNNDGTITFSVGGGTAPYYDTINNSDTTHINLHHLVAGSYHLVVTDAHGCYIDSTITITQPPAFTILVKSIKEPSCFGFNDGQIVVKVLPTNNYTYYLDGTLQGTNDTLKNISGGTHTIRAQVAANCFHDTTLVVNQPTKFTAWVKDSLDIRCKGDKNGSFSLSAMGGTPIYSFEVPKLIPTFLYDSVFAKLPPNSYIIYAEDAHGCLDTLSVKISEPDSVLSKMILTDDASCYFKADGKILVTPAGGTQPYNVTITPTSGENYLSPTQAETGYYSINVTDNHGCVVNDSLFIDVKCCLAILPNAFSPNNDGIDDVYRIVNPNDFVQLIRFKIYNRWGEEMFVTNDKTQGWDGTVNGVSQPIGTYVYFLTIQCSKGRTLELKGNVTLLR